MTYRTVLKSTALAAVLSTASAFSAQAVFFHIGSGSIDGSLCVGNDCVSSEAFGFDTIRLKENNLRLHFDDTSTTASFPRNDWRLYANDSANGGSSYFGVEDATAGRFVFRVFAGARSNALTVDSQGDLGLGTATPATDIDIKIGDTPTVRLQQDGTSGFTPQTWDVAGNEAGFFIRDATGGSTLPFRILTGGAPSQSLVIDGDGEVGIGAGTNPDAPLHVQRSSGGLLTMIKLENNGDPAIEFDNTNSANPWVIRGGNRLIMDNAATAGFEFDLFNTGNLTIGGTLTENSDKNNKMAIEPVDPADILGKVAALPVSAWTYKHDAATGIRHIGPMAQDFYALFGTGAGETGISTLDSSGVALAAIQALAGQNAELRSRIETLEDQLAGR